MPAAALPRHDKQHGTNCIVPALAKNARTGHPQFRNGKETERLGHPSVSGVTITGTCGKSAEGICRRDRRDVPQFFRRDANPKEIHSRLVTSDLAHSFRFVHDCPSKGSKSSESDKGRSRQKVRPQLFYFADFSI